MNIPRITLLSLVAALVVPALAADKPKAWTDPAKAAADDPDYAIQGEYIATIEKPDGTKKTLALQVIALGDGKFHSIGYVGGLPGNGWNGEPPEHTASTIKPVLSSFGVTGGSDFEKSVIEFRNDRYHTVFARNALPDGRGADVYTNDDNKKIARFERANRKSPTLDAKPPEGATVLFDGTDASLAHWNGAKLDGDLLQQGATTKAEFGSFTLHIEFLIPYKPSAAVGGQDRANSGVYIHNRYEVQVLDAFGLPYFHQPDNEWRAAFENDFGFKPASDRKQWTASLYQFKHPTLNMSYPPLAWQTYDIDFTAATFDADGKKTANARVTVKHNGVVVQDDIELPSGTGAGKGRGEVAKGPILLQEHGNPVRFRNIWLVPKAQ